MDTTELSRRVREMLAAGRSMEDAIALLRDAGCSKGQSILVIAEATAMDLAEATQVVTDSQTWSDRRESDIQLNDALWDLLERVGGVQPDGSVNITRWLNAETEDEP